MNCPRCGTELGSGEAAGLCPRCLIAGALGSSDCDEVWTGTVDPAAAAAEEDFGRYRIIQSLGEGGMGTVHLRIVDIRRGG